VTGITFSKEEAELAGSALDRIIAVDLDEFVPPEDFGRFDVVICSHVLEHLRRPKELLQALKGCLRSNGRLIVSLPNALHWRARAAFLMGNFKYTEGGVMDTTHLRFYDRDTCRELVAQSGFTVREWYADGNVPLPFARRVMPRLLSNALDRLGLASFPGLFAFQFVVIADV
jgi:2-polyprenyl-3-methyl-5-hydroxy-6-metoxy-1,4-benzoquinol methylase